MSNVIIKGYHVKHNLTLNKDIDIKNLLLKAKKVADYAVKNKNNNKILTSKYVKQYGLPSTISNQILRKYGKGTIKEASNINLIVPNATTKIKSNNNIVEYHSIEYNDGFINIKPLKLHLRWNPGKKFKKINQIEISESRYMIVATFDKINNNNNKYNDILGIDHNCGVGRHIINAANLKTGEVLNLGKRGPNIRKMYYKKRQKQKIKGNKEKRIMKDLDHKISRKIVDYALKNKLKIVVEKLSGIRKKATKRKGCNNKNRLINSWSFYRLQTFIEYKAKEYGIPFIKINPHYTSQECSYCTIIGDRDRSNFICKNKKCKKYNVCRNADINAAFNVGKRSLLPGGRAQ